MYIRDIIKMHHANMLLGGLEEASSIKANLEDLGFGTRSNPDFFQIDTDVFGIDHARKLRDWFCLMPMNEIKVCLIVATSLTSEAQNALLKIVEDPQGDTKVFLIMKSFADVIPTLRSRFIVANSLATKIKNSQDNFWFKPMKDRLDTIRGLQKEEKDSLTPFFDEAENYVLKITKKKEVDIKAQKRIILAKRYVGHKGVSKKMILEWLAYYI